MHMQLTGCDVQALVLSERLQLLGEMFDRARSKRCVFAQSQMEPSDVQPSCALASLHCVGHAANRSTLSPWMHAYMLLTTQTHRRCCQGLFV